MDQRLVQQLRQENERLKKELQQTAKELSFFINTGKALTSTIEFQKVLRVIMEKAQRLIKCEAWALFLIDESTQELYFGLVKGKMNKKIQQFRLKIGEGTAGWVVKNAMPVMVPDVRKDHRFSRQIDRVTGFKSRSILCVPIVSKKKTIGALEMINKHREMFEKKDLDLLTKLVDQAAIALERSSLYQKMADLAVTDDLTKLFNFRYLDQTLDTELKRSQRYGAHISLIFFDMDYFKLVNDRHGHLMGSKVLIEVAQILINSLRDVDIVSRYGGDEFVVVLPETKVDTAIKIAHRLHRAIREHEFLKEEGLKLHLSASYGISGYPDHAKTKKDLIRLADQAMYKAKSSGRDRICITGDE
jgi:diguanylate cyclase (GGDEF)-like protein